MTDPRELPEALQPADDPRPARITAACLAAFAFAAAVVAVALTR